MIGSAHHPREKIGSGVNHKLHFRVGAETELARAGLVQLLAWVSVLVSVEGDDRVSAIEVELLPEQALTRRWLRRPVAPQEAWQWLAGRAPHAQSFDWTAPSHLTKALWELGEPLASYSNQHEREALDRTIKLTAALFSFCHTQSRGPALACQERMLASCLLPLYRGLGRGSVQEVTSVMRRQLADTLTMTILVHEFDDDLARILSAALTTETMPFSILESVLPIEVERLTQRLLFCAQRWDGEDFKRLDDLVTDDVVVDSRPAWGAPHVLWRLAGELIADRAEFVVPRDWISVPVPWNQASDHWRSISQALHQISTVSFDDILKTKASKKDETESRSASEEKVAGAAESQQNTQLDEITRLKLEIEIANSVESLLHASRHANRRANGNSNQNERKGLRSGDGRADEFTVPKIIIAEVRSHNDPAFMGVVRRQLGICRSQGRTLSLLAVRVQPDREDDKLPTLLAQRLSSWQQKLVNWMADHPDVHDPYAFISNEGELILCLIDIERHAATCLLRHGLLEVLTGQSMPLESTQSLPRAIIAAHYHSGIGCVCSPTAGFEPEQLIEATYRCLAAAQRNGKASIKSIEVF